jgi:hypothetical protein
MRDLPGAAAGRQERKDAARSDVMCHDSAALLDLTLQSHDRPALTGLDETKDVGKW